MSVPSVDTLVSLMQVAMSAVVWTSLVRQCPRLPLALWVSGALTAGACGALFSTRAYTPAWAHDDLANFLVAPAFALRIAALRLDLGLPSYLRSMTAMAVVQHLLYLGLRQSLQALGTDPFGLLLWPHVVTALWALVFAWHGALVGRQYSSRSGWLLAAAEASIGVALLLRAVAMLLGWTQRSLIGNDWAYLLIVAAGFLGVLYGNLGYIGLVLDRTSSEARQARDDQISESLRREAAEQRSAELGRLLTERNQVLHLLAHEIRQPLHNASGALQAAARALSGAAGSAAEPANAAIPAAIPAAASTQPVGGVDLALQRAQGVLGRVHAVLDNTLAAAQLFARDAAPDKVDTDLDLLVHLTLGDLTPQDRARVQIEWQTSTQSIELEPGLVRLALRNLLNNAFEHGGAAVSVRLVVAEQTAPLALVLRVVDDGPALPGTVWARLHEREPGGDQLTAQPACSGAATGTATATVGESAPAATTAEAFRRGLGVALARQVMRLHGGQLHISRAQPQGVQASLVFPLPDADRPR